MQLGQVVGATLGQVAVCLGGDTHRHRRLLHQLGAGLLLAAEHDHRHARGADPGEAGAKVLR